MKCRYLGGVLCCRGVAEFKVDRGGEDTYGMNAGKGPDYNVYRVMILLLPRRARTRVAIHKQNEIYTFVHFLDLV